MREGRGERLLVVNNFYADSCEIVLPTGIFGAGQQRLLIGNYPDCPVRGREMFLRPYESFALYLSEK